MSRIEKEINAAMNAASVAHKAGDKAKSAELDRKIDRLIQVARELFHAKQPRQPEHFILARRAVA